MSKVRGQPRSARHGAAIVLSALVVPQGTLLLLRTEPSLDLALHSASVHLVVVSAISACALAVAVAAAVAAATAAWSCSPLAAWPSGSSCWATG